MAKPLIANTYRIIRELGKGQNGQVHLAECRCGTRVAIKTISKELERSAGQIALFRREARLLASVAHENVLRFIELTDKPPALVTEYIATNETLADFIERYSPIPIEIALDLALQLCAAVRAIHDSGIVHRDIKPANVMVAAGPRVVLMDFGMAKETDVRGSVHIIGTPDYIAPEQICNRPRTPEEARRCDVYALGMSIYELFAGQLPFESGEVGDVLRKHQEEDPMPPSLFRPDLSKEIDRVILKTIAREPSQRFQTCDEFICELKRLKLEFTPRFNQR